MAKSWAAPFYNSRAWRKCRKAYAESKFFLCEVCGEAGEEVHHIRHEIHSFTKYFQDTS